MEATNELQPIKPSRFKLKYFGDGSTYFGIVILNLLLTIVTLGLYYPWAKAAYRKYSWNELEMKGSRFTFHGTGKEMFKGFLIVYALIIGYYVSAYLVQSYEWGFIAVLVVYALFILVLPLAIYGAFRYRLTRTSWRGIFFQFDGNFKEFLKIYIPGFLLAIVTLGIYMPWLRVKIMDYLFSHTKLGDLQFGFKGDGGTLFGINIVGVILTTITLYLYIPVYIKDRFNFTVNHTTITDGVNTKRLRSTLTGTEAWKTIIVNFLLLVVTLGLAFPWTFIRTMRMFFNNLHIPNDFDFDNLSQSEQSFADATADQVIDVFDIDMGF